MAVYQLPGVTVKAVDTNQKTLPGVTFSDTTSGGPPPDPPSGEVVAIITFIGL